MADKFLEFFREEYDLKDASDEQLTGFIRDSYPSLTNLLTSDQVAPTAPTLSEGGQKPTGAVNWGTDYTFSRQTAAAPEEPDADFLDADDLFKVKRKDWRRREMPAMMQNWPESEVPEKYKTGPGQPDQPSPDDPRYWEWVGEIDWDATQAARMESDPTDHDYGKKFVTKSETRAEQESWNMGTAASIQREKETALAEGESWWAWTVERLPIAGGIFSANQLARTFEAGRRLENGEAYEGAKGQLLYRDDVESVADYLAQMERADEKGMLKKTGDIISRLPGYAVEFGASGGAFTWTRKGFEKGMEKLVGDRIKKKIKSQLLKKLGTAGLKSGGFIAGGLGQAALMPQMTLENFASIMAGDGIEITQDQKGELGAIFAEDDPSFGLALYEALAQTGVESITERMGFLLSAKTLSKIPGLKAVIARRWLKAKPGRTTDDFLDAMKERVAWNGIIGEIGEERFAEVGRAALTREKYPDRTASEWGEQILIEGMAFSVPALGRKTIDVAANRGERRLLKAHQNMIDHLVTEAGNLEALMGTMPWAFEGKATPLLPSIEPRLTLPDPNQEALEATMPWVLEGDQGVDVPKPELEIDTGMEFEVEETPSVDVPKPKIKAYENTPDGGIADVPAIGFLSGVHNENIQKSAAKRGDIGLMITPSKAHLVTKGQAAGYPFVAIDNGKFTTGAWSAKKFTNLVDKTIANVGLDKILFAVAPDHVDIVNGEPVGDAAKTLKLFEEWEPVLRKKGVPVAFVAQDGLQDRLDEIPWDKIDVMFIGGSTAFKLGKFDDAEARSRWESIWEEARKRQIPIHVGRVNTGERLTGFSTDIGASTVDGTAMKFQRKGKPNENQEKIEGWLDEYNKEGLNWKARNYGELGREPTERELHELALDPESGIEYQEDLGAFWPARVRINEIRKANGLPALKKRPATGMPEKENARLALKHFNELDKESQDEIYERADEAQAIGEATYSRFLVGVFGQTTGLGKWSKALDELKETGLVTNLRPLPETAEPPKEKLEDSPKNAKLREAYDKAAKEYDDYTQAIVQGPGFTKATEKKAESLRKAAASLKERLNKSLRAAHQYAVEGEASKFIEKWEETDTADFDHDMEARTSDLLAYASFAEERGFSQEHAGRILKLMTELRAKGAVDWKKKQAAKKKAAKKKAAPKDEVKKTPPRKKAAVAASKLSDAELDERIREVGHEITRSGIGNPKDRARLQETLGLLKEEQARRGDKKEAPKEEEEAPTETEGPKEPPSSPTTLSMSGQKEWLTTEIDRAIREAPKVKSLNARQLLALHDLDEAVKKSAAASEGGAERKMQDEAVGEARQRLQEYGVMISFAVPGDGTFSIINQPKQLKEFKERVKKQFPSKKDKYKEPPKPSGKPKGIAALGKEKQTVESFIKALFPMASKEKDDEGNLSRTVIAVVNSPVDGELIVTNGKGLIRIKHPDAKAGQSWKVTGTKVEKVEQGKNLPKFEQIMHKAGAKIAGFDTAELLHILNSIQALKTKSGVVGEADVGEIGVRIYSGPKGWSLRATSSAKDEFQAGVEGEYITTVGTNLLADMVTVARRLGEQYVTLHVRDTDSGNINDKSNVSPLIIQGDKIYGVLMPLQGGSALDSGPLKSVQDIGDAPMATHEQATLPRRIEAPRYDPNRPGGDGKGKTVSLQEIREFLAKALDIPIRLGIGRRPVLGLFYPQRETIRMKALNNIPTVAHEVGHYLHYIMFPKAAGGHPGASNFEKQFDTELNKLGARTSRPSYTEHQVRKEGVAEFVRLYMTDRAQALASAPKFHKFFQENLEKYPEINGILEQATDMIQTYVNQPAKLKVGSLMGGKGEKVGATVTEWLTGMHDKWVNELAPIERAIKLLESYGLNVPADRMADQLAINYMGGWRGKVEHSLFRGQVNFNGEQVGPSLREVLGGVEDMYDFQVYLVAKRAIEKIKQGKEVGIDMKSAQEVVSDMQGKYEIHRQKLDKFLTNELKMLEEAGFISAEEFTRIKEKNQDYVPFFRLHDRVGSGGGSGRGFIDLSKGGLKAFKGSDLQIHPPLESVVKNMYLFRDLAERNRVGRAFVSNFMSVKGGGRVGEMEVRKIKPVQIHAEEIEAHLKSLGVLESKFQEGLPGADELLATQDLSLTVWRMTRTESAAEGIFSVWKDGKQQYYMIKDPGLYTALKLMDSTAAEIMTRIPLMGVLKLATRTLRGGATLTMEFMARNPWRDQISAGVYSRHGFVPFFDGFRGLLSALKMDKHYWAWVKAGGKYADFISMDAPSVSKKLGDVTAWKQQTPREMWPLVKKWMNPMHSLRKVSELMEMATRLQEFKLAKKKGKSDVEAANASKDITLNFTRFGLHGKLINQVTAFYNATMQDWNKLYREHKGPNKFGVMTKSMLYITVPSILTWWLGKDDEEIQSLPTWRKLGFWNINLKPIAEMAGVDLDKPGDFGIFNILPYPGMGDWVLSLPKPFLLGQLYGSSVEAALSVAYDKDPEAVTDWLINLTQESPLPFAIDPDMYENFKFGPNVRHTPTLARPVIEAISNTQLHTGRPLHSDAQKKLPGHQRINPSTSEIMRWLAKTAAIHSQGNIDPSPIIMDNTVKALFAGLGKYGLDYADWFFLKFRQSDVPIVKPEKTLLEKPVIRGFFKSPYEPSARVGQFYDAYRKMETRYNGMRPMALHDPGGTIIKREVPIAAHYEMPEAPGGATRLQQLRAGRMAMSALGESMRIAQSSANYTRREKADRLVELKNQRDDLAAGLVLLFHPKDVRNISKKKLIPHKLLSLPVPANAR